MFFILFRRKFPFPYRGCTAAYCRPLRRRWRSAPVDVVEEFQFQGCRGHELFGLGLRKARAGQAFDTAAEQFRIGIRCGDDVDDFACLIRDGEAVGIRCACVLGTTGCVVMCYTVVSVKVEFHQTDDTVVLLVVVAVEFILKLFLIMCTALRIVRVVRFNERLERLAVFVHQAGGGKIAGEFHNRRVDVVFVVLVISMQVCHVFFI